jgi:GntR family transcriptional regulator, transcriptional repressor for pyruvate dehydrogenase complex
MKIEKLQFQPAYRAVSVDLRQRIVRGEAQPGDALPTESELAGQYGVHRSTVREGLRHLEQDGLVRRDGKRLVVTVPSHQDLAQAAERALRMRQVTYHDVWELASHLEPLCARLASERISESQLKALENNLEQTRAAVNADRPPIAETIGFQTLVAESTQNQALQLARAPVSLLMRAGYSAIAPALPQSGRRLLEAHRRVFEALKSRDAEAAVLWTRKHMLDHKRGCELVGFDMHAPIAGMEPALV